MEKKISGNDLHAPVGFAQCRAQRDALEGLSAQQRNRTCAAFTGSKAGSVDGRLSLHLFIMGERSP